MAAPGPDNENGTVNHWHPPGLQDGAIVYEDAQGNFATNLASGFGFIVVDGTVYMTWNGPTTDPIITGVVYSDSGTLKVSTGIG